jgi:hypothetical protein
MSRTVEELVTASVAYPPDETAIEELADCVGAKLHTTTTSVGTGALIALLLPGCTKVDPRYRPCVTALSAVRRREDCLHMWEYTGKKNHFGKPALRWLPQF